MKTNRIVTRCSKSAKIVFSIFVLLLLFSYIFYIVHFYQEGKVAFKNFYKSNIIGAISCKPYAGSSGTYFCVDGNRYNFHPYTDDINDKNIFSRFANIGDSIYKPAHVDTLVLIKEEQQYYYTFSKDYQQLIVTPSLTQLFKLFLQDHFGPIDVMTNEDQDGAAWSFGWSIGVLFQLTKGLNIMPWRSNNLGISYDIFLQANLYIFC